MEGKQGSITSSVQSEDCSKRKEHPGAPGWLSRLSIQLWLRSWSPSLWVRAPHRALCWQLRAWSLLQILCLLLSLPLPRSFSLSLSKINIQKNFKKLRKKQKKKKKKGSNSMDYWWGIKQVKCGKYYQFSNMTMEMRDQELEDQRKYSEDFKASLRQKNDEY